MVHSSSSGGGTPLLPRSILAILQSFLSRKGRHPPYLLSRSPTDSRWLEALLHFRHVVGTKSWPVTALASSRRPRSEARRSGAICVSFNELLLSTDCRNTCRSVRQRLFCFDGGETCRPLPAPICRLQLEYGEFPLWNATFVTFLLASSPHQSLFLSSFTFFVSILPNPTRISSFTLSCYLSLAVSLSKQTLDLIQKLYFATIVCFFTLINDGLKNRYHQFVDVLLLLVVISGTPQHCTTCGRA